MTTTRAATATSDQIVPFTVSFGAEQVADLRERLARTRFPADVVDVGTAYGMPGDIVRAWSQRWRDGFDFAAAEARLNAFPQFTTPVDGVTVHFWHVRAAEPTGVPLLLLHGWPSTVLEMERVVGPLTAAGHDVVVPSLPGIGFGGPATEPGWDSARRARALATLMTRLGYERWGVAGGDMGALVARELGILAPAGLVGVHVLQIFAFPTGPEEYARLDDADRASLESGSTADFQAKNGYQDIQSKRPNTLAFALEDSPAGLLAWNAELWSGWGDHAAQTDVDTYLTHLSVYWFTGTAGSAARAYYEDAHTGAGYRDLPNDVPTAVAVFPLDFRTLRVCAERANRVVRYTEMPRGGHFAYATDPDLVVRDLLEFFATV